MNDMPLPAVRKVWLIVAILSLLVALEVMVATQGWPEVLQIKNVIGLGLPDDVAEPISAYWGLVFLMPLLIVGCWFTLLHARQAQRVGEARWPGQLLDFGAASPPGRAWALLTGLVFGLFPLYTLGHAWRVFLDQVILCEAGTTTWSAVAQGWGALWYVPTQFDLQRFFTSEGLRIGGGCDTEEIARAIYAFPVLVPFVLLAGLFLVAVLVFCAMRALRR